MKWSLLAKDQKHRLDRSVAGLLQPLSERSLPAERSHATPEQWTRQMIFGLPTYDVQSPYAAGSIGSMPRRFARSKRQKSDRQSGNKIHS
jgi:hypothetical protein